MYWSIVPELRGFVPSRENGISPEALTGAKKGLPQIRVLSAPVVACLRAPPPRPSCASGPHARARVPGGGQTNHLFNAETLKPNCSWALMAFLAEIAGSLSKLYYLDVPERLSSFGIQL